MLCALITHPACAEHDVGFEHPERPERLSAINDRLVSSGLANVLVPMDAEPVSREKLISVHNEDYVQSLYDQSPTQEGTRIELDEDTAMMNKTLKAAEHAAGAGVMAVDQVMGGSHKRAFCAVRPPGHHAETNTQGGFCYFNNIVIAARHAIDQYGLQRVTIVDFDVHHGNGTEEIVAGDERILLCSSFESPLYPFCGENSPHQNVCNIPLEAGMKGPAYQDLVSDIWLPKIDVFAPQLILISAGFDAHAEDDISHINLVERDYRWITVELAKLADKHADGRIVSMLEGGYSLSALGRSVHAHIDALI